MAQLQLEIGSHLGRNCTKSVFNPAIFNPVIIVTSKVATVVPGQRANKEQAMRVHFSLNMAF